MCVCDWPLHWNSLSNMGCQSQLRSDCVRDLREAAEAATSRFSWWLHRTRFLFVMLVKSDE